ncbi:hypothetical protein ACJDT4_01700 [Clostridium neuense]|uniref:Uncharacterized protein n=1 Tax=Clostridium neuense TaxID=1728934 RepID=A0ABW8T9S6_9CLOT
MEEFLTAAERKKQTEEAIKNININNLVQSYIEKTNSYIKTAAERGASSTLVIISENDAVINKKIGDKIVRFLIEKGFKAELKKVPQFFALEVSW